MRKALSTVFRPEYYEDNSSQWFRMILSVCIQSLDFHMIHNDTLPAHPPTESLVTQHGYNDITSTAFTSSSQAAAPPPQQMANMAIKEPHE
jgi:hypothetical protein